MAEEEGFEPPRPVKALSVFKTDPFSRTWVFLQNYMDLAGLEPATIRLEGGCSIQLSYGRFYLHSVRSADLKLRPLKKLFLLSHLTQQQAVLDKRGECYRGSKQSSTANSKKFQLDKGVTTAVSRFAFAV